MSNYFWGENVSTILNYSMAILLFMNLIYITYTFIFKKVYYGNTLISFAIYFTALFIEPVSVSIKFNSKYGYEVVEIIYILIIIYIISISIISNNNYIVYNVKWKNLKKYIVRFLKENQREVYQTEDSIYIENYDSSIKRIFSIFRGNTTIIKVKGINGVFDKKKFDDKIRNDNKYEKISRFYYLIFNVFITIVLLLNLRY